MAETSQKANKTTSSSSSFGNLKKSSLAIKSNSSFKQESEEALAEKETKERDSAVSMSKQRRESSSSVNSSIADNVVGDKSDEKSKQRLGEESNSLNYEKFKAKETKSAIDDLFE